MDSYEDMFKEITRKLYGEEGMLQTANNGVISGVFNGVINGVHHKMSDYETYDAKQDENSIIETYGLSAIVPNNFEADQEMMSSQGYQDGVGGGEGVDPSAVDQWYMTDESLDWTTSKIASYNPAQKLFRCIDCECCGFLARVAEHWLGTHANLRVFQCPQCSYSSAWARCVRMHLARQHNAPEQNTLWTESPVLAEVTKYLNRLKARVEGLPLEEDVAQTAPEVKEEPVDIPSTGVDETAHVSTHTTTIVSTPTPAIVSTPTPAIVVNPAPTIVSPPAPSIASPPTTSSEPSTPGSSGKRYSCTVCPYSTDRRDLYTRHEAIHCEEKPFHCYVCQKQFNRADHVKKHFLRMHRDQPYDLNRIRRSPPKSASGMSYYTKYNGGCNSEGTSGNGMDTQHVQVQQSQQQHLQLQQQQQQQQEQEQITMQSTQPLLHQQTQQTQQLINIPTMASYQTTMSRVAASTNQILKTAPMAQETSIIQQQISGQMTSVITDATKMTAPSSSEVKPEIDTEPTEVPRTKGGREKRYPCPYCSWSGVDNWCLKRHLNTHLKPFVCSLCDYKAARTERLQTHVLKVHNKRMCSRCNFMADDETQLSLHMQEHHGHLPCDQVTSPSPSRQKKGGRRSQSWNLGLETTPGPMYQQQPIPQLLHRTPKRWRPKPVGAERLFNYMEASDSEDEIAEEIEILQCQQCGCDFLDAITLESHMLTHHRTSVEHPFRCSLCGFCSTSQAEILGHIQKHSAIEMRCMEVGCRYSTTVQASMEEHNRLAHPSQPPLSQKCPHCGFVVLSGIALTRHQKTHHLGNVNCTSCIRVFNRFHQHNNGEMWSEDDDSVQNSLMPEVDENTKIACKGPQKKKTGGKGNLHTVKRQSAVKKQKIRKAKMALLKIRKQVQTYNQGSTNQSFPQNKHKQEILRCNSAMQKLRMKYLQYMACRRKMPCHACPINHRNIIPIHTPGSLMLHRLWRHSQETYACDSCDVRCLHRYQIVLHAGREHTRCPSTGSISVSVAEPIVTLTVPQITVQQQHVTEIAQIDGLTHSIQIRPEHEQLQHESQQIQLQDGQQFAAQQLQPQLQQVAQPQTIVYHNQNIVQADEVYTAVDNTRVTVAVPIVPVVYSQGTPDGITEQPQQDQQDQQFHASMYNGMMVPKQVWYPQLPGPTYYISTQFPST